MTTQRLDVYRIKAEQTKKRRRASDAAYIEKYLEGRKTAAAENEARGMEMRVAREQAAQGL